MGGPQTRRGLGSRVRFTAVSDGCRLVQAGPTMVITAQQPSGQLVGRARELAEFDQTLDRVASGPPWTVELVGEPGIGKSRLLGELRARAKKRGFVVLDGRAA